ncbi:hypothetical protein AAE478_004022 [Parahypoxylon ruwenzoriense]
MPIDRPSCKERKRGRIAPNSSLTAPSSTFISLSSRITKPNKSQGLQAKSLALSLADKSFSRRKRQSATADAAGVTSVAAAAATTAATATPPSTVAATATAAVTATGAPYSSATATDELGTFSHQAVETRWDQSIPSGLPSCGGELIGLGTNSGTTDHFTLSSTLVQTQGPNLYNWSYSAPRPFSSSSLNLPVSYPQHPYLPVHENFTHGYPWRSYSADYSGFTGNNYSGLPLLPSFGLTHTPTMIIKLPFQGDDGTSPRGTARVKSEPSRLTLPIRGSTNNQSNYWGSVGERRLVEDGNDSDYDSPRQVSDISSGNTPIGVELDAWERVVLPLLGEVAADETGTESQAERRSRRLKLEEREATSKTRKLKCREDPENPRDKDCLTCRGVKLESKKVIHRLPCLRWKLAEIVLFREGGLNLTKRWTGVRMKDLGPKDWASAEVRRIQVTIGCRRFPLELSVRRFHPNSLDVTWKHWVDPKGNKRRIDIEPFALADITKTAREYDEYVYMYACLAVREYTQGDKVDVVVRKTYDAALRYVLKLDKHPLQLKGDDVNPLHFLNQYFRLWFAIRNTLGSAFIVGPDTLEMLPIDDEDCPYHGTVSIPRMIPAQFDSLAYEKILTPLRKQVLEGLWRMIGSKSPHHFFTIYLTVFMFLHEVSVTSADRLRRARDNKIESHRYDLASFVERLQEGANIVLSYWHYYKRDVNPLMMDTENKKKAVWGELSPDEVELLAETSRAYKEKGEARLHYYRAGDGDALRYYTA